ncbi:hypothetical protein GYMLUDRAFT_236218 [Collybiopsis luxurians FD-317 M1]|nr:hypothetical protein GYMLUDRAFT_236218 [Collybiopsis luxurians FD-317 M1]
MAEAAKQDDQMAGAGIPSLKRRREPSNSKRTISFVPETQGESSSGQAQDPPSSSSGPSFSGATGIPEGHDSGLDPGRSGTQEEEEPSRPQKRPRMDYKEYKEWAKSSNEKKKERDSASKKHKKGKGKKKSESHKSLHLHIRILWNLLCSSSVPKAVSTAQIKAFNEKFADVPQSDIQDRVEEALKASQTAVHQILDAVDTVRREAALGSSGSFAKEVSRMETTWLERIFSSVAAVGLDKWEPDLLGGPESVYNTVHEHVALSTYQALLAGLAYVKIAPKDLVLRGKMDKCRSIYRKYVFGYQAGKFRLEMKKQGGVQQQANQANTYKRHTRLCDNRETEAHSDDEADPNAPSDQPQYFIHRKVGRNYLVTNFFRQLDDRYHHSGQQQPGQRGDRKCVQRPADDTLDGLFTRLPGNVPIDYFDPDYYNNFLSVELRAKYAANGVALPLKDHCEDPEEIALWKNMNEEEFMQKYGNDVLALYNLPTQEELDQMNDYNSESRDEDEEDED